MRTTPRAESTITLVVLSRYTTSLLDNKSILYENILPALTTHRFREQRFDEINYSSSAAMITAYTGDYIHATGYVLWTTVPLQ